MIADLNLTKEFFDKQETDDTLQNIRKQYLASKKNLHDLMLKQNESNDNMKYENDRIRKEPSLKPLSSLGVTGAPSVPAPEGAGAVPVADNFILLNELRSLKNCVYEQQSQIRKLTNDLQLQKNFSFELQSKVLQLQSHVKYLESDMVNYFENASTVPHSISAPSTATATTTTTTQFPLHNKSIYSYSPSVDDNTTKLIQMSEPK